MKLTEDQILDIMTVGEAKAIQQGIRNKIYLVDKNPIEDKDEENTYKQLGFFLEFRPEPETVHRGMSTITLDTVEISQWWSMKKNTSLSQQRLDSYTLSQIQKIDSSTPSKHGRNEDEEWAEESLELGIWEFLKDWEWKDRDYNLCIGKKTYESWEPFAKELGINELVTVSTKVPKALALKLQKFCTDIGETPSWRMRMLLEDYLLEKMKDSGRTLLFT